MSVQGEINRIKDAVSDAYSAVSDKGGEIPSIPNVDNLAQAVNSIPTGPDDIFVAEYGVTTYQEIDDAYNSGKTLLAFDDGRTYLFAGKDTINGVSYYKFYTFWYSNQAKCIRCHFESNYPNNWDSILYVTNEITSNKKITIDDTTKNSNTYYPTTKAVYDFVNEQKAVFMAEYGTTTMQEILDAYHAGKTVKCYRSLYVYDLVYISADYAEFSSGYVNTNRFLMLSSSGWTYGSRTLLTTMEVTQSISTDSTSTNKYPSAKAVYDYIQSLDAREVSY